MHRKISEGMDLLKAEIERKRKATAALIDSTNPESRVGSTRFVRQSDVVQQRLQQQLAAQEELDAKRRRNGSSNVEAVDISTSEKGHNGASLDKGAASHRDSPIVVPGPSALDVAYANMTDAQVRLKLRQLGQPVALFGESAVERLARLSNADRENISKISHDVETNEFRLTGSGHDSGGAFGSPGDHGGDNNDEEEDDEDRSRGSDEKESKLYEFVPTHFSDDKSLPKRKVIYKYFRFLLKSWEWDLNKRPEQEKRVVKGKMETKMQKQCRDYIRHLFKLCKRDEVPPDIEDKLFRLVCFCEEGNFRAAHDLYLQAAIGNAAWPIGLTMVGIHERSGREKISTSKVAHVMNNEAQRKYFTSVKRLMSYAQQKRPDVPPSMKVL